MGRTESSEQGQPDTAWRTRNVGRLLFSATHLFLRAKLQAVNANGGLVISEATAVLLQTLDRDGTRPSRIAARATLPKQSVGEAVDRAEALGLVERRPDPEDGRAKIVAFTPAGLALLDRLRDAVAEAERAMADIVGADVLLGIKARLGEYVAAADLSVEAAADLSVETVADLSVETVAELAPVAGADGWRRSNIGRLMMLARRVFVADVLRVSNAGGAAFTEVQLALFRNIDLAGTRLTVIAARAGMTKQAMAEIVDRAAAAGFVDRLPDRTDRRAKTVLLTAEGRRVLDLMGWGVARAEARLAEVTDPDFVEDLRAALKVYTSDARNDPSAAVDQDAAELVGA